MRRHEQPVAVPPGQAPPATLSPSRAKDFRQCQLKFYFGAVAKWRIPPTEHTLLGNVVHEALEVLYQLPGAERTEARAAQLLDAAWETATLDPRNAAVLADAELAADIRTRAGAAVTNLFELENPATVDVSPAELEAWVEATLVGAPLRGRIDRMTTDLTWTVSDYKTGRVPDSRYVDDAFDALFTYAACLAASDPDRRLPDHVELLYLLEPRRLRRPVIRARLREHARRQAQTWRDIQAALEDGTMVASTGPLCEYCSFAPACPAVSRGAPPVGSAESDAVLAGLGLTRGRSEAKPDEIAWQTESEAAELAVSDRV